MKINVDELERWLLRWKVDPMYSGETARSFTARIIAEFFSSNEAQARTRAGTARKPSAEASGKPETEARQSDTPRTDAAIERGECGPQGKNWKKAEPKLTLWQRIFG